VFKNPNHYLKDLDIYVGRMDIPDHWVIGTYLILIGLALMIIWSVARTRIEKWSESRRLRLVYLGGSIIFGIGVNFFIAGLFPDASF
jgi:hypothetical membrane protein